MRHLRSCVVGIVIGAAVAFVASCSGNPKPACGPSTCDGCCSSSGECVGGKAASSCGSGGGTCDVCSAGESCSAGKCEAVEQPTDAGMEDAGMDMGQDAGMEEDAGMDAGVEVTPYASYDEFVQARVDALCQAAVTCSVFTTVDACKNSSFLESDAIGLQPAAEASAIKDGRATFDGVQARICVDQLTAASCANFSAALQGNACKTAVTGAVAVGGACFNPLECVSTAYCSATGDTCPGTCLQRLAEGQPATSDEQCLSGLWADRNGACAKKVPVGESCAGASRFLPPLECVDSAWCNDDRICQAKGGVGATCDDDTGCLVPYVCSDGTCAMRGGASAACTVTVPCALDLACDATGWDQPGTCAAPRAEGGSCFDSSQCSAGLFCRGMPTPDHCAQPNAIGDACDPFMSDECATSAYCDSTSNTCQPKAAVGAACTDWNSCLGEAYCEPMSKTCLPNLCSDPTP